MKPCGAGASALHAPTTIARHRHQTMAAMKERALLVFADMSFTSNVLVPYVRKHAGVVAGELDIDLTAECLSLGEDAAAAAGVEVFHVGGVSIVATTSLVSAHSRTKCPCLPCCCCLSN